ncbi:MAG: gliding motility-associated C-terminal domain-containing protein [Bacteroidota bacterium]
MPKLRIVLLAGLLLITLFTNNIFGQTSYSGQNWYFGNSDYAIRFSRPDQDITLDDQYMSTPFGTFGNATANEPETGDLLFYTDGRYVYDANHLYMDGTNGGLSQLNADQSKNQNTAIISTPGNNDRYIIFTNTSANEINYSVVDMTQSGNAVFPQPNLGSIAVLNDPVSSSTATPSDAMLALAKTDLSGYWLITVDDASNTYKVLEISDADPATWNESIYNLGLSLSAANLSYSDASGKIAVSPRSNNTNIHILDFDRASGVLAYDTVILNSGYADVTSEAVYDVEWSSDGTKLYVSRYGGTAGVGDLLQWDSTLPSSSSMVSVLPSQVFGSYGLQTGPDGNIYHLYQDYNGGPFVVGGISDADSVASLVQYNTTVFNDQNFNSYQFPALLPERQLVLNVDFTFAGTCSNSPTSFYPLISPAPDNVYWDFGDGIGNSSLLSPIYTYASGGTFNVTLTAEINGQTASAVHPVPITQFDLQLTLVADTIACQCELPKYGMPTSCTQFSVASQVSGGSGSETYEWSNGDTGPVLTPDSAGYYYVIVTDPFSGCSTYGGVNVQEYGLQDYRANVWYFGQNAGIDFNPPAISAIGDSQMDAPEGCTAISDRNGIVIFYTDGNDIWVKDKITGVHSLLDTNLGGQTGSAQSVIAVPFPGDETLYYIFTTEETGSGTGSYAFSYSIFDVKMNNGAGGIAQKGITLFTESTERLTANSNWVIIHEYGNNNFRAYPITGGGLGNAVVSSIGSDHSTSSPEFGQGYMKFSVGGDKLAVALAEGPNGPNYLEVFEWDNGSGELTDFIQLDLTADGAVGQVYGVEFDPSGTKLFATVSSGGSSMIMEYRADTLDKMHVVTPIMTTGGQLGAIQTAPTGQLYVAIDGSNSLGAITVNPDTATASTFTASGFTLAGGTNSGLGLPNYSQAFGNLLAAPGYFVSSPICLGQPISLAAIPSSSIDTAFWQIADASNNIVYTTQNLTDTTTLAIAGDYLVSLQIGNRCGFNTAFSYTATVNPLPQTSSLPPGLPLCGTSALLDVYDVPPANMADLGFLWSTTETTSSITVTATGNYTVAITDTTSGCMNNATVFVGPPFTVNLGPDLNMCEGDALTLDCQANASVYDWYINNNPVVPANNQRTFDFGAQALPGGTYTVRVEVEDPIDPGCIVVEETIITVGELPSFTAIETSPVTLCSGSDGVMTIDLTSAGNFTYSVLGPLSITGQAATGPNNNIQVPNLIAGVYTVVIINNVSACAEQVGNILITEPAPFAIANVLTSDESCLKNDGQLSFELSTSGGAINYVVRNQIDLTDSITGTALNSGPGDVVSITTLADGSYSVEVERAGCTNSFAPITINPTPVTDLQVIPTIAECGTTLDFTGYASSITASPAFEWSLDSSGLYNPFSTLYDSLGNKTVFIKASSATTCDSIMSIDVTLVPTPIVVIDVDSSSICNGQVILTAIADGGFDDAQLGYRWTSGETTESITLSQSGTQTVSVSNLQNLNCFTSENQSITIPDPFSVTLTSTLACDDGKPFTLTATPAGQSTNNLTYAWELNGVDLPDITSQIQSIRAGAFVVTASDPVGCSNSDSLEVIKAPVTPTNLSSAIVFCPDDGDIILDAGPDFISYLWDTGETTQSIDISAGGIYRIEATNNFNCITTDQSEVLEDCIPKVFGPNAFRPGGVNKEFFLYTEYVEDFEIFIFNKWGDMVFHSSDISFKWNGTLNGELLPAGQYSYVVRFTSSFRDRGTIEQYGGVVLLR